jgi:hypothetical protein
MEVEELTIPKQKCEEELGAFKVLIKTHRKSKLQQIHKDLHRIYGHIQKGGSVIQLISNFQKAGLNNKGNPKLAITRADGKICYCCKRNEGSVIFSIKQIRYVHDLPRKTYGDIELPDGTFDFPKNEYGTLKGDVRIETLIPIIPVSVLAPIQNTLKNYHILWEVEEWKRTMPPRDPILVKIINQNIALVLATWNLTELERAVIQGRL